MRNPIGFNNRFKEVIDKTMSPDIVGRDLFSWYKALSHIKECISSPIRNIQVKIVIISAIMPCGVNRKSK